VDALAVGQRLRTLFRRTRSYGLWGTIMTIIDWPLTFLRDYTIPLAGEEAWDKQRAIVVPFTMVIAFFYLFGMLTGLFDGDQDAFDSSM